MRFSPVLFAALTAAATLGMAQPTQAQSLDAVDSSSDSLELSEQLSLDQPTDQSDQDDSAPTELLADAAASEWVSESSVDALNPLEWSPFSSTEAMLDPAAPRLELAQDTPEPTPSEVPLSPETAPEPADEAAPLPEEPPEAAPEPVEPPPVDSPQEPTPAPPPQPQPEATPPVEPRVLVAEVVVTGAEGELADEVYRVIRTRPGRTTTRSQLQEDINAIFGTGFFSNVQAIPEDTPLGVRVTFAVQPNPVLQSVRLEGSVLETIQVDGEEVPLQDAVDQIFAPQYGQVANLRGLQAGIEQLNQLYRDNGYVLAQVIGAPEISPDGVATLEVAEGVIEDIQIRFLNQDGEAVDEEGNPIRGRTRPFIITREFESQPGDVFNQNQIRADLQRAFGLGIFEDLNISLDPGQDPRQVDVIVNVTERRTGSLAASVGVSSASGLFGAVSLQEQNLGGNNQRLNAEVQVGQRDVLFDISFTDPWIATDPNRTSYTVNAFGRQSIPLVFDGGEREVELPNGQRPRVRRFGGGVSFSRPLGNNWRASLGAQYQNVTVVDADGDISPRDEFGNLLSFNESGTDNIATLQFSASQDLRNDPVQATSGSVLRLSTEQSLGLDSIFYNRLRASYSYFIPVRLTAFTEGCRLEDPTPSDCPQALAFNVQGGTILGDFPPYEAFSLGGTDSVRGYDAGELGSGASYLQATIEYRFPIINIVSGALFVDAGTDLGTADDVQGNPAGIREKPGSGFGYGIGLRVQSPLGQIRVDYAINDDGESRFHFGIGERF
ncbi:MAG: BamA/TamA family outer membrane protein [Synechococcales cyanobacterium M58_A2018_015]|nr:BamA/TamA family outer membrane protein [Synechococcales cyanobacterium M58_A2018_015]